MQPHEHTGHEPARESSNGLGLAGFIVSLLGILGTCGLLSPVGLVMSAFAMRKEPKGFAIAGLVLGIVGTVSGIGIFIIFGFMILGIIALASAGIALNGPNLETWANMTETSQEISAYHETMNALPESLDAITTLDPSLGKDAWGNTFIYTTRGENAYSLTSAGEDALPQTEDDIRRDFSVN